MGRTHKNNRQLKLLLSSSAVFCVLSLGAVLGSQNAVAQEAAMRSAIDPESPLAQSPIKNKTTKLRRKGNALAQNTSDKYTTQTLSDADIQAEALQLLYGENTEDNETLNNEVPGLAGSGTNRAKPATSALAGDQDTAEMVDNATSGSQGTKTTATKNGKPALNTNGKTALEPGLDEQTTGTLAVRKGQRASMLRAQPVIAEEAVQSRDLTEETDPFKAVGFRFGSMTLRPALEQGLEVTTNNTASAGGGAATNSVTTLRLDGTSDWRSGSLETNGFVTLRKTLSGDSQIDPEAGVSFTLTQPILRDWSYSIGGTYGLKRESAVSGSAFPTTITKRPLAQDVRLSLGVGKTEGVLQPSARLEFDRLTFGDATDSAGLSISQSDRDQTSLRGTFRLGAEVSPAFTPFVEVAYGKTWRDDAVDVFGNDRSSTELRAAVGAEINLSEKLNGEVSVGWLRQSFESAGLADIDGVALAAALNWSPVEGTTVSAGLTTNAEPANSATISGSVVYASTLALTHQLSSRLSTTASLGISYRDFTDAGGNDTTLSAELAATYWVNRTLGVNARARHESVSSSDPTRGSDTTTLLVGLKLQR